MTPAWYGALAAEGRERGHFGVAGPAVEPGPAAGAQDREVVGLVVAVRAVLAEGGDRGHHEAGFAGADALVGEAEGFRLGGRDVVDEDVGVPEEAVEHLRGRCRSLCRASRPACCS